MHVTTGDIPGPEVWSLLLKPVKSSRSAVVKVLNIMIKTCVDCRRHTETIDCHTCTAVRWLDPYGAAERPGASLEQARYEIHSSVHVLDIRFAFA